MLCTCDHPPSTKFNGSPLKPHPDWYLLGVQLKFHDEHPHPFYIGVPAPGGLATLKVLISRDVYGLFFTFGVKSFVHISGTGVSNLIYKITHGILWVFEGRSRTSFLLIVTYLTKYVFQFYCLCFCRCNRQAKASS